VAFTPEKYDSMKALVPLQWLYQVFVFTVLAVGVAGVWNTYSLARTHRNSYAAALIVLIVGIALAVVQMAVSRSLRGKSMPSDLRLYVGGITLLVFLLLRLPGVWQASGMSGTSCSPFNFFASLVL
jgi:fucose 4-O-acetylase-like acetyltransferase